MLGYRTGHDRTGYYKGWVNIMFIVIMMLIGHTQLARLRGGENAVLNTERQTDSTILSSCNTSITVSLQWKLHVSHSKPHIGPLHVEKYLKQLCSMYLRLYYKRPSWNYAYTGYLVDSGEYRGYITKINIIISLSDTLPPLALRRRQAKTVLNCASSLKIN